MTHGDRLHNIECYVLDIGKYHKGENGLLSGRDWEVALTIYLIKMCGQSIYRDNIIYKPECKGRMLHSMLWA